MTSETNMVKRALVTTVIEETLLGISSPLYEAVVTYLKKVYNCYLPDCYEHPEYLAEILKELCDNSYDTIVKSINEDLEEFSYSRPVAKFLEVISNPRNLTLEIEQRLHYASHNLPKIRESLRKGDREKMVKNCKTVYEDLKEVKNLMRQLNHNYKGLDISIMTKKLHKP